MLNRPTAPNTNKYYFFGLTFILSLVILFNLFNLQIAKGSKYFYDSNNSYSVTRLVRAPRGIIYDRNGVKLVENEQKYDIYIIKDENRKEEISKTIDSLAKLFNENIQEKYDKQVERFKNSPQIEDMKIYSRIDYSPYVFQIEANYQNFPQIKIEKTNVRKYLYPELTSHIIGYTGDITQEDYKKGGYDYGDEIGKFGIELGYDDILRGRNGLERIDVNPSSAKQFSSTSIEKTNGADIYLTIDIRYQQKLYDVTKKALEREEMKPVNSTASVLEDVNTGEILAMISYPTFDSNLFIKGISQEDYAKYLNNPGKPLSNKAIQYAQSPGSIVKTLTDMVLLEQGAIDKNTQLEADGTWEYGGVTFQDANKKKYGKIDVVQGLCVSSNIFHMKSALMLDQKTNGKAANLFAERFEQMGLNKVTDLKLGTEAVGYYPTPEKMKAKGENWLQGYLLNASIGQGEVRMTPLEAVKLASTVASKGTVKNQSIVKTNNPVTMTKLNIQPTHFDTINEGMKCAAGRESWMGIYDTKKYPEVSEKTGTAETGQIKDGVNIIHGWEITHTPSNKPELAMSVFLENGQFGYRGGYISREFYKWWYEDTGKVK